MTAHAIAGDREKSMDAGMDDHVTKPIDPDALISVLLKWIEPGRRSLDVCGQRFQTDDDVPSFTTVDVARGVKNVGGNKSLYKKLLIDFYHDYSRTADQMEKALAQKDHARALRRLHTIKGVAGNIGAFRLSTASADLERSLQANDPENTETDFTAFSRALHGVLAELRPLAPAGEPVISEVPEAFSFSRAAEVMEQLAHFLEEGNCEAEDMIPRIRETLTMAELKRQHRLLENIALLDGLTDIPNYRSFRERFAHEWQRAMRNRAPLSLGILDVDYFKQYNDTYGHGRGDEILKTVAAMLTGELKRPADFAARYGGEEFAILMPETDGRGAVTLAETICRAIGTLEIEHGGSSVSPWLTVSIGGATAVPSMEQTEEQLFECADTMLYEAKKKGRNQVVWEKRDSGIQVAGDGGAVHSADSADI